MLWVKEPLQSPNLPKNIIISDCYSALKPSTKQWDSFLEIVEDLKQKGTISERQYDYLKNYQLTSNLVTDLTKGVDRKFCEGDVTEITKRLEEQFTKDLKEEINTKDADIEKWKNIAESKTSYIQVKDSSIIELQERLNESNSASIKNIVSRKRKNLNKAKSISKNIVLSFQFTLSIIALLVFLYSHFYSTGSKNSISNYIYLCIFGVSALNIFGCKFFNTGIHFKFFERKIALKIYVLLYKN